MHVGLVFIPSLVRRLLATVILLSAISLGGTSQSHAATEQDWNGENGGWEDAMRWGGTLPSRTTAAQINGSREQPGDVSLSRGNVLVGHLAVGDGGNSRASLTPWMGRR